MNGDLRSGFLGTADENVCEFEQAPANFVVHIRRPVEEQVMDICECVVDGGK